MKENGPLDQPSGCPDWVFILMHQCWTYEPMQRPPFIAIIDCLSRRYEILYKWIRRKRFSNLTTLQLSTYLSLSIRVSLSFYFFHPLHLNFVYQSMILIGIRYDLVSCFKLISNSSYAFCTFFKGTDVVMDNATVAEHT